jgi:hypothetical protein
MSLEESLGFLDGHLADDALGAANPAFGGQIDQLHGPQRLCDLNRNGVRIEAE